MSIRTVSTGLQFIGLATVGLCFVSATVNYINQLRFLKFRRDMPRNETLEIAKENVKELDRLFRLGVQNPFPYCWLPGMEIDAQFSFVDATRDPEPSAPIVTAYLNAPTH